MDEIEKIKTEFWNDEIDRMRAIELLQDQARSSLEAEEIVEQWEHDKATEE